MLNGADKLVVTFICVVGVNDQYGVDDTRNIKE